MKVTIAAFLMLVMCAAALAEAPDISALPPHPRLWIGGLPSAAGYIDPATLVRRMETHPEQFALLNSSSSIDARALAAIVTGDKDKLDGVVRDLKGLRTTTVRERDLAPAALAFDWIAPALSEEDRLAIARHLGDSAVRVRDALVRFNAFDNNPLRRDMCVGLTALAIAGHDPRAEELFATAHALFEEFMSLTGDGVEIDPAVVDPMSPGSPMYGRGHFGGGWPEGHDYDRHGSRYAMIYFLGLRSATGIDVFSGSRFWQAKIPYQIHHVLPNRYSILPFEDNDHPQLHRYDRELMLVMAREFRDPYARWFVNHVNTIQDASSGTFEFLYNEPTWPERDIAELPRAHYVPGTGLVMARSGWGENDTYVAFSASDWYVYHQNNSANVFAIYRNAPLAVKDGVYDGSVHNHFVSYSIRTISYNGITVYDPDEVYRGPDSLPEAGNDGGQMIQQWKRNPDTLAIWRNQSRRTDLPMRDVVDWLGFEANDDYVYAAAEAGRAYRPGKVPFFSRQVLFLYPNSVVIFDRVTAGKPEFVKKFHLHAPEDMEVSGREAVITTRETNRTTVPGRLFVKSLLPKDARVERVDGIAVYGGKSWVGREAYSDQFYCPHHLEITAPEEETSFFLTAMYACDADVDAAPEAGIVEETGDSVTVSVEGGAHVIRFNKTGPVAWEKVK